MRKILYVYHSSVIGGGSFCLYNIIKKLDKNNYKPLVLLREKGPLSEMLESIGAIVYYEKTISTVPYNKSILSLSSIKKIYILIKSIFKFNSILKKLNPDIVYLNTMMMYPYLRIVKKNNLKTIIHIREHWPRNEHRFQLYFAKKNIEKYANKIIAINETSAKLFNIRSKTTVVYDWIDFSDRNEDFPIERILGSDVSSLKIYTYTGGIDQIKGTFEVIKTFSTKIKDPNARLLVLGADTNLNYNGFRGKVAKLLNIFKYDTYWNNVKKMIKNDNRIFCIPPTYKIKQIIEKSYCILSYFTIPHANLILAESVYLGKIAIAASTSEALEYSNNGESAILFEINNIHDFYDKIEKLNKNYDYYSKNAMSGIEINKYLFNSERNSNLLNSVYDSLINQ